MVAARLASAARSRHERMLSVTFRAVCSMRRMNSLRRSGAAASSGDSDASCVRVCASVSRLGGIAFLCVSVRAVRDDAAVSRGPSVCERHADG